MNSPLFHLTIPDWLKGIIMAFLGGAITVIYTSIQSGGTIDWKSVGLAALSSGVAYIVKNFFSASNGAVLGIEATASTPPSAPLS